MAEKKLNGTVIVTYRCNARCSMCNRYKAPSKPEEEISIETIKKLPKMYFTNITGGEPFIRTDLKDKIEKMFAHDFDYQAIARDAIERYSSEAYYHKLMEYYK